MNEIELDEVTEEEEMAVKTINRQTGPRMTLNPTQRERLLKLKNNPPQASEKAKQAFREHKPIPRIP